MTTEGSPSPSQSVAAYSVSSIVILLTFAFLKEGGDEYTSLEGEESMEVTWSDLLRAPGILITCFGLVLAGSNWTW